MGRTAWLLLGCGLVVSACSRINPLFSDVVGETDSGGKTTGATTGALPTNADVGDDDSNTSEPTTTTPPATSTTMHDETLDPTIGETRGETGQAIDLPTDCSEYYDGRCDLDDGTCEEGYKCAPVFDPVEGLEMWCVELQEPTQAIGDPCELICGDTDGVDTCDFGSTCVIDVCRELCNPVSGLCSQADHFCFVEEKLLPFGVCLPSCDPLQQDCPDEFTCIPNYPTGYVCVPDASGGLGDQGSSCVFENSCNPGFICIAPESEGCESPSGCCSSYCELSDPACNNPVHECLPVMEPAPPSFEDVGVCALPLP